MIKIVSSMGFAKHSKENEHVGLTIVTSYSSCDGLRLLAENDRSDQIRHALRSVEISRLRGSSRSIRNAVQKSLSSNGWALDVQIGNDRGPKVNALHPSGIALQLQLGNISRAFYDLMKLNAMWDQRIISVGVLVLPVASASQTMGSNIANFERVSEEHSKLFSTTVNLPLVIYGFNYEGSL